MSNVLLHPPALSSISTTSDILSPPQYVDPASFLFSTVEIFKHCIPIFTFFGILVLVECFQLWKLPLSLWNLTVWLLPKIKQGQQEGVWTIHTHTFTWSCLWWWNSVCTCRNATSSKSGKLQLLKAAQMENQDNGSMKTSLKLVYFSPVLSPNTHPWSLISRRLLHH